MHNHFEECTLGGKANKSIVYMLTFEAKNGCMLAHTNGKSQSFNCLPTILKLKPCSSPGRMLKASQWLLLSAARRPLMRDH